MKIDIKKYKKKKFHILFLVVVLVGILFSLYFFFGSSNQNPVFSKIDQKIYRELEANEEVRVIVMSKDPSLIEDNLKDLTANETFLDLPSKGFVAGDKVAFVDRDSLQALAESSNVEKIFLDQPVELFTEDSIKITKADLVYQTYGLTGEGVKICVVDTGFNKDIFNLTNKITGKNILDGSDNYTDDNGHGTQVIWPITQIAPNSEIIVAKALNKNGFGYTSDVLFSMDYCEEQGADIISLSLGGSLYDGYCDEEVLAQKVNELSEKGILTIAATGNDGSVNSVRNPSCSSEVLGVTATSKNDQIMKFANYYASTLVASPGHDINTYGLFGESIVGDGTSYSSSILAGLVSLVIEKNNLEGISETPDEIKRRVIQTGNLVGTNYSQDLEEGAVDTGRYFSRVNVLNLINNNITNNLTEPTIGQGQEIVEEKIETQAVCTVWRGGCSNLKTERACTACQCCQWNCEVFDLEGNCLSGTCDPRSSSYQCDADSGFCDVADYCGGTNSDMTCPDQTTNVGEVCRGSTTWSCSGSGSPNSCQRTRTYNRCDGGETCPTDNPGTEVQYAEFGEVCDSGSFINGSSTYYSSMSSGCSLPDQPESGLGDPGTFKYACDGTGGTQGEVVEVVNSTSCSGCCYDNGTTAVCISSNSYNTYDFYNFSIGDVLATDYCAVSTETVYNCYNNNDCSSVYVCGDTNNCKIPGADMYVDTVVVNTSTGRYSNSSDLFTNYTLTRTDAPVQNVTDWRLNGTSLAVLNMPFELNVTNLTAGAVKDYSTYANNGTLGGGTSTYAPIWTSSGRAGGAYDFTGNDFIEVNTASSLENLGPMTVSVWIYPDSSTMMKFLDKDNEWSLFFDRNSDNDINFASYGANIDCGYNNMPLNQWHHIAFLWNEGSSVTCIIDNSTYLNGAAYTDTSPGDSNTDLCIGSDGNNNVAGCSGVNPMEGKIDELMIFDRLLTRAQIEEIYSAGLANHKVETIVSEETQVGQNWSVRVTPVNSFAQGEGKTSDEITILSPCSTNEDCDTGEYCNVDVCEPKLPNDNLCDEDTDCQSNNCIDSFYQGSVTSMICCDSNSCVSGGNSCVSNQGISGSNKCYSGTWIADSGRFEIEDVLQNKLLVLDKYGSMVTTGTLTESCVASPPTNSWRLSGSSTIYVDSSGNLCVPQSLQTRATVSSCTQTDSSYKVRDTSGTEVARMTDLGYICLKGDYSPSVSGLS